MHAQQTVGPNFLANFDYLKKISCTKSPKKFHKLLEDAPPEVLLCITEAALNILKNNFKLKNSQLEKLKPHAKIVREISRSRTPKKTKTLIQSGNGFPAALPLLLPILIEVAKIIKNV